MAVDAGPRARSAPAARRAERRADSVRLRGGPETGGTAAEARHEPAGLLRTPVNNTEYFPPNFEGLVLGCSDADFCK